MALTSQRDGMAMAQSADPPPGPDFAQGVPLAHVPAEGVLAGNFDGAAVLLAWVDGQLHAVGGACTHYGAPLAEGLVRGDEIRCPWHHACFSLRTGAALSAPAFAGLSTYTVEIVDDVAYVRGATPPAPAPLRPGRPTGRAPERIVIVGAGASGFAAAERLRGLGYEGSLTLLGADADAPYDRPNLSKDFLAGTAPEEWIPLQPPAFYAERAIDIELGTEVATIDAAARVVSTANGARFPYDSLLIATGAEPRALRAPGFDRSNVHALRSLGDARAIVAAISGAHSVAIVGAGFIGLEAAGALQARGLEVHVVAPEVVPMAHALGPELGRFLLSLHASAGVVFHLGVEAAAFDGRQLTLKDGTSLHADVVLVGVGVQPRTSLATAAGLAVDDGIVVDEQLRASIPGHYAAGDVARYPYRGELVRVEHWVHAQRQGQAAAANLLGAARPFTDVPFFWTHHQGLDLRVCGLTSGWDEVRVHGSVPERDFLACYFRRGVLVAASTVGRDRELLTIEQALRE